MLSPVFLDRSLRSGFQVGYREGRKIERAKDLKKRRRRRQRERQKAIVFINKTLALHVHYKLWYISLPSSAKPQREMTTFKLL